MSEPTITLPEPQVTVSEYTYDVPNMLLAHDDGDRFKTTTVREGKAVQVDITTQIDWSLKPADERSLLFLIRGKNRINFGTQPIAVINDALTYKGEALPPTSPTASEYLAKRGKRVLISFDCGRDNQETERLGVPVYKIVRNSIILP